MTVCHGDVLYRTDARGREIYACRVVHDDIGDYGITVKRLDYYEYAVNGTPKIRYRNEWLDCCELDCFGFVGQDLYSNGMLEHLPGSYSADTLPDGVYPPEWR